MAATTSKDPPSLACFTYAENPKLHFVTDKDPHRRHPSRPTPGSDSGLAQPASASPLALPAEVSLAPDGDGETIGFRDARIDQSATIRS